MQANELTFGVEIECFAPVGMSETAAAEFIARTAGLGCHFEGYNHRTPRDWKIVTDGSLRWGGSSYRDGIEVVSPILQGTDGLAQLHRIMSALEQGGFKVNQTCGLHVHVGVGGASGAQIKNLAKMYLKYANEFDALLPVSRRGVANGFCRNNRTAMFPNNTPEQIDAMFDNARSMNRVAELMNGRAPSQSRDAHRYFALNFQSYATHGTVEFRQHSGTVNSQKAVEWVKLLTGFVAVAFTLRSVKVAGEGGMAKLLRKTDRAGRQFFRARIIGFGGNADAL